MLNTCKSNGVYDFGYKLSGERVSKAQITCLKDGDNNPKGLLIPNVIFLLHGGDIKREICFERGLRPISLLVG